MLSDVFINIHKPATSGGHNCRSLPSLTPCVYNGLRPYVCSVHMTVCRWGCIQPYAGCIPR